jgi:hypothetical protein
VSITAFRVGPISWWDADDEELDDSLPHFDAPLVRLVLVVELDVELTDDLIAEPEREHGRRDRARDVDREDPVDIGDLDLVALVRNAVSDGETISRANQLLGYLNDGSGHFTATSLPQDLSALPSTGELRPLFADFDNDGRVDLAVAWDGDSNNDGTPDSTNLRAWLSGGRTLLQASAVVQQQLDLRPFLAGIPSAVDLNADGQLELVLSGSAVSPNIYSRQGHDKFVWLIHRGCFRLNERNGFL